MARRGRKPHPVASPKLSAGGLPRCPAHLDPLARKEWRRLARTLYAAGILTVADRAAFAAYCQSYSLCAEAVKKMRETPKLIKTPAGYVQQSPWLGIANKQLELMGRYMAELGITPTARARLPDARETISADTITRIVIGSPEVHGTTDTLVSSQQPAADWEGQHCGASNVFLAADCEDL